MLKRILEKRIYESEKQIKKLIRFVISKIKFRKGGECLKVQFQTKQ